jgi:hypothetical protein
MEIVRYVTLYPNMVGYSHVYMYIDLSTRDSSVCSRRHSIYSGLLGMSSNDRIHIVRRENSI